MMHSEDPLSAKPQHVEYGTFKDYAIGFGLSIFLTLAAYFLVLKQVFSGVLLDASTALLGLIQAAVQLVFFLHMMKEPRPRWNIVLFLFMLMVLIIIVFGSLWIMNNLNYNLMEAM
jgi:cytochrome o ubiquinol oxidase operon protein cyoD